MEVKFNCTSCRRKVGADHELIGVKVHCPACDAPLYVPSPHYDVGEKLGDFRIEQWLGSGAMGEVYLAIQEPMGTEVALKILAPEMAMDDDIERFQQEVRLLARITHPGVVTAVQAGEQDGKHYLAMSYVDGETVEELVERNGPLDEPETLRIGLKVAQALEYAWDEVQLLHRDVKPANIMIDEKNGQVKLMDMGIAKSGSLDANLTMSGMLLGTPHYMSPEQARGLPDVDCRSDIYALGATLFHLLVGEPAHEAENALDVLARKLNEEPPDVRTRNAAVSEATAVLIQRMMGLEREDRAATWTDQIVEIKQAMEGIIYGTERAQDTVDAFLAEEDDDIVDVEEDEEDDLGVLAASTKPADPPRKHLRSSRKRTPQRRRAPAASNSNAIFIGVGIVIVGLFILILFAAVSGGKKTPPPPTHTQTTPPTPTPPPPTPPPPTPTPPAPSPVPQLDPDEPEERADRNEEIRERLQTVMEYARNNQEDFDGILNQLYALAQTARKSREENRILDAINRVEQSRKAAIENTLADMHAKALAMIAENRFDDAIDLLQSYDGKFADATAITREKAIVQIRDHKEAFESEQAQQEQTYRRELDAVYLAVGQQVLAGNLSSAQGQIRRALAESNYAFAKDEIALVDAQIAAVAKMPTMVRESLERQIGREVSLRIAGQPKTLVVSAVTFSELQGKERVSERGMMGVRYRLSDLSVTDKLARLRARQPDHLTVMEGVLAVEARAYDSAEKIFARIEGPLSVAFDAALNERLGRLSNRQSELAFRRLLERNGLDPGAGENAWLDELSVRLAAGRGLAQIRQSTLEFMNQHSDSDIAARYATLLGRMSSLRGESWPGSNAVFFWASNPPDGAPRPEALKPRDRAKTAPGNDIMMRGGAFLASHTAGQRVLDACRRSDEISIELVFATETLEQSGPARIFSFSQDGHNRNFTIGQEGANIVLRLRTTENGSNGSNFSPVLCTVSRGRPYHLLVTYRDSELNAYVGGNRVYTSNQLSGDLSNWASMQLLFGDEFQDSRPWSGIIRAAVIYDRAISPAIAPSLYQNYIKLSSQGQLQDRIRKPNKPVNPGKPGKMGVDGRFPRLDRNGDGKFGNGGRFQRLRDGVPQLDPD